MSAFGILFVLGVLVVLALVFLPIRLWIAAKVLGAPIGLVTLVAMRLRKVSPEAVINPYLRAVQAGVGPEAGLSLAKLEAHYLAGGNSARVADALIEAHLAAIDLDFDRAAAIDLAGRNVLEAVEQTVNPKVFDGPAVTAITSDGYEISAKIRYTARSNLRRLVGGAGAETLAARLGEAVVGAIGAIDDHQQVIADPDQLTHQILQQGLDAGTAFELLAIDLEDVRVGSCTGAPSPPRPGAEPSVEPTAEPSVEPGAEPSVEPAAVQALLDGLAAAGLRDSSHQERWVTETWAGKRVAGAGKTVSATDVIGRDFDFDVEGGTKIAVELSTADAPGVGGPRALLHVPDLPAESRPSYQEPIRFSGVVQGYRALGRTLLIRQVALVKSDA